MSAQAAPNSPKISALPRRLPDHALHQFGQHGNDDAERDHIEQHDRENEGDRRLAWFRSGCRLLHWAPCCHASSTARFAPSSLEARLYTSPRRVTRWCRRTADLTGVQYTRKAGTITRQASAVARKTAWAHVACWAGVVFPMPGPPPALEAGQWRGRAGYPLVLPAAATAAER